MSFIKREGIDSCGTEKNFSCRVILIRLQEEKSFIDRLALKSQREDNAVCDAMMRYAERVLNIAMLNMTYVITL